MGSRAKRLILSAIKQAGLLQFARYHTRRGLRILCYHALSWLDEHQWNPVVFMTEATFRRRMKLLHDLGAPVVPLDAAVSGDYPDNAVVITFDDGWDTTYRAAEIMAEFGFPSTVYVATYHVEKGTQVFNMAMRYAAWKTAIPGINLPEWNIRGNPKDSSVVDRAIEIAADLPAPRQQEICDLFCAACEVDTSGRFGVLDKARLRELPALGMDVQLHTHRHHFSLTDAEWNRSEIRENRTFLAGVGNAELRHFCFPSGRRTASQYPVLAGEGIITATTSERCLNFAGRHPYELGRFMDSDALTEIEFEAELMGATDLLRNPRLAIAPRHPFRIPEPAISRTGKTGQPPGSVETVSMEDQTRRV